MGVYPIHAIQELTTTDKRKVLVLHATEDMPPIDGPIRPMDEDVNKSLALGN